MYFSVIMNVLSFLLYIFMNEDYQGFYLPGIGANSEDHYISFDTLSMNQMMMIKILLTITIFIQARGGLNIVNPIMKQYRDAQNGITNGVAMTERKNKKMKSHMKLVKGLTCIWFLATIICVPLSKTFIHNFVDDVIDVYYEDVHNHISAVNDNRVVIDNNEPENVEPSKVYDMDNAKEDIEDAFGDFKD